MTGDIKDKGLRWNANRINEVPDGKGLLVIFDDSKHKCTIEEADDLKRLLRANWWKHNFWYFSWFRPPSGEELSGLKKELETMSYDDLWNLGSKENNG